MDVNTLRRFQKQGFAKDFAEAHLLPALRTPENLAAAERVIARLISGEKITVELDRI